MNRYSSTGTDSAATTPRIGNAAARAERLRQLERAMMLDPDPDYRAQAKAEYLKLTSQDVKGK